MGTQEKKKPSQGSAKKPTRNPTTHELTTHQIEDKKPHPKKQPSVIRSVTLTADNEETLEDMRQTATDYIGRATSSSAIIRALVRYAGQQPAAWIATQIQPLIEAEIEAGRLWGTKSKTGKP